MPRRFGLKLAVLFLSGGMIFALGEVAIRLVEWTTPEREAPARSDRATSLPTLRWSELTQPDKFGLYAGGRYRTNSAGFRGREVALEKPSGNHRVVIIGDSITMGQGVDDDEAYPARIERLWNTETSGEHEVLNLGLAGNNARASINRLERLGLRYNPDLIIYGFTTNDLEQLPGYSMTRDKNRFRESMAAASHLWRFMQKHWYHARNLFFPDPGSYIYELEENYYRNPEVWNAFAGELLRLDRLARKHRSCLAIFIHATTGDASRLSPSAQFAEPVANLAHEIGIPVIHSRALYLDHNPEELRVGPLDNHPNALAHELLTRALVSGLADLPDSCGTPAA